MTAAGSVRIASEHALSAPPAAAHASTALFLDIDGTLLDFAATPDLVAVDPSLKTTLRALWTQLDGALAPLSGRPLAEIDRLLDLPFAAAGGLHGAELRAADGRLVAEAGVAHGLAAARERAEEAAKAIPGVLVEDKGSALALHYRLAPDAEADALRAALDMQALAGPGYELLRGNRVFELKPAATNKGTALATLMRLPPFAGRTAWMIGDDLTDEDAFAEVNALGGVAIVVGARRPTHARYALESPAAARAWLARFADAQGAPA